MDNDMIKRIVGDIEAGIREHAAMPRQIHPCIFKVCREGMEPENLAIGPMHRGKDHLEYKFKITDELKVEYLNQLSNRMDELFLENCLNELTKIGHDARLHYATKFDPNVQTTFVRTLLHDGCFIVELLRKYNFPYLQKMNDSFFKLDLPQVCHDMLLFENQIPFLVVERIFDITKTQNPRDELRNLFFDFVTDNLQWHLHLPLPPPKRVHIEKPYHIFALFYRATFSFPRDPKLSIINYSRSMREPLDELYPSYELYSASKLKNGGISFIGYKGITLMDVAFDDGVIKLPQWTITKKTEGIVNNLMTYELHCNFIQATDYVIEYLKLMNCLVQSRKDFKILEGCGVIINTLDEDDGQMVRNMFQRFRLGQSLPKHFVYSNIFRDAKIYMDDKKTESNNTWLSRWVREFFQNR